MSVLQQNTTNKNIIGYLNHAKNMKCNQIGYKLLYPAVHFDQTFHTVND